MSSYRVENMWARMSRREMKGICIKLSLISLLACHRLVPKLCLGTRGRGRLSAWFGGTGQQQASKLLKLSLMHMG
ncbi:MAG: hypothetical protein E3K32_11760 [wastewater metagenome]|nr:hypothetical protein [Candidatus Loosdrechtia aerotolerans]